MIKPCVHKKILLNKNNSVSNFYFKNLQIIYGFGIISYKPEQSIYKVAYIFPHKNHNNMNLEFCSRNEELIFSKIFVSC